MISRALLSEAWRDIIAIASAIVTLLGFGFAYRQLRKTKSAAYAASESANRSYEETKRHFSRYVFSTAMRFLSEAKLFVNAEHWEKAPLRIGDLADQISQPSDADSDWEALLGELRLWELSIAARPMPKGSRRKWDGFIGRLQSKKDSQHGPFKNANQ